MLDADKHARLVEELVRACFTRGLLSGRQNRRLEEYRLLLRETPTSVEAALDAISVLDSETIEGYIEAKPGTQVKAWYVLNAMANIVAANISKHVRRAIERSDQRNVKAAFAAMTMLPPLIRADDEWNIVNPRSALEVVERIEEIERRLTREQREKRPYLDLDEVREWRDSKRAKIHRNPA